MVLPLRILLPCLVVSLAASGAVAIGVAGVSAVSGYLTSAADDALRTCTASVLGHDPVAGPGSGPAPGRAMPGACGLELRSADGQPLRPAAAAASGPVIRTSGWWLSAHQAHPVTVPGASGGRWRVVVTAIRYQPQRMPYVYGPDDLRYVISGPAGPGSGGLLIVMTPLAGPGRATAGYAAAAVAVLVLLAAAAFAMTRAVLRPLREATGLARTASQGPGSRLEEAMACLSVLANRDHERYGTALARMRERLNASCAAEAAARRSTADMSSQLSRTCLQLRRPASILYGFTQYGRQQDSPPPAGRDQLPQRITDEITRMETLADGLRVR